MDRTAVQLPLPDPVVERLRQGAVLAPTLREQAEPDGTRYAILDVLIEVPIPAPPEREQVRRLASAISATEL